MEAFVSERMEVIKREGYTLSFGDLFSRGFEIWKKVTLPMAGAILLLGLPVFLVIGIAYPFLSGVSYADMGDVVQQDPQFFQELSKDPVYMLKMSGIGLVIAIFLSPVALGFLQMCRDADTGLPVRFATAFSGYRSPYLGRVIVVSLITGIITQGVSFGLQQLGTVGGILNYPVSMVISTFLAFTHSLIIFGGASAGQSISGSITLASKNFFPILGALLLTVVIVLLGVLLCCVGLYFTIPFYPVIMYMLYHQAVGFPEDRPVEFISETEGI